jgi:hypothetical protein
MVKKPTQKTMVEIGLPIWAGVRYFATINKISNNSALETLLSKALKDYGVKNKTEMLAGEIKFGNYPPAASDEVL